MQTSELLLDDNEAGGDPPRWREVVLDRAALVPVLVALLLLLGLALGAFTLRQNTLDAETRTLSTLVAALADQADSALAASQTAMEATADELTSGAWRADDRLAGPLLRTRAATLPWVRQLLVASVDGTVLQAANANVAPPRLDTTDYFRAALGAPKGSANLGAPEHWRGAAAPLVPLSMPWYGPQGRQVGVIVLAADLSLLVGGFTRTRPATDAGLHLLRGDGQLWLSEPAGAAERAWPGGEAADSLIVVDRAMQRAPLNMLLTRDGRAVLRDWRVQVRWAAALGVLALLATAALSLRHARELRWREQSQRGLQRQQARAARAFDAAREGLWEWEPQRRRHFLSPRMRELAGFAPLDAAPAPSPLGWSDRIDASDLQQLQAAVAAHLQQATPDFSVTLRVLPPGLPPRHVRVRGQSIAREGGGEPALAGTAYDVTEEVVMAERARALDEQLQRARRLEALGTLAGGVAHDFNNVLAAIQGYGERARDLVPGDGALGSHLDRILDATRRGKTLAERITASGQLGVGQRRAFEPRELLLEAWALATQGLPAGVQADIDAGPAAGAIEGDPVAFFEACLNLLRNAVQALQGQGTLRATLAVETLTAERVLWHGRLAPGRWLRLGVVDDGPGIAPEHLPYLLDPFFTTRAGRGGTGLGMTVVHNTVRDAGGALDLHTGPGEGTRFDLYVPWLPLPAQDSAEAVAGDADAAGAGPAAVLGTGQVVLVVDDEPALAELLEETLAEWGYEPRAFTRPEAAWAEFERAPGQFDAIVTDQLMPGLEGLALIARCRALAPDVPAIIVTAYGGADFDQQAARTGVSAVLRKPLAPAELRSALAALFAPAAPAT